MYNMWSKELQCILQLRYPINLEDAIKDYDIDLVSIVKEVIEETITKEAWKLCMTHNLTLDEAKYIIAQQLAHGSG